MILRRPTLRKNLLKGFQGCLAALLLLACAAQGSSLTNGAVATAHPLASEVGRHILESGGNAFDATVAVSAALAVVEPYGSGLGGGGFFLLREAGDPARHIFLDARERAPAAATPDMYLRDGEIQRELSLNGPLAAAIPGTPAALVELAEKRGRLPLKTTLAPAIALARDGFAVDAVYRHRASWRLTALRDDPESARLFLHDGDLPAEGHLLRQAELAETLERLASQGRDGFYRGEVAERLVQGVRAAGGIWTLQDLADYHTVEREPLRLALADGRELIGAPPPSAGGMILAQSLGILERLAWRDAEPLQRSHLVVEALRRAYRDRGLLGDPDFVASPLPHLLSDQYLEQLASSIDPDRATPSIALPPAPRWREGEHTTHFAVIDAEGNAVAATLSLNMMFGAAFTVPGTGVLLNDEMDDFAADIDGSNAYGLKGSSANAISGGKRPLSSMSPTFIESAEEFAAFGTPGGSRIPSMVLLSALSYLDGEPVQAWPAVPRYHHQYLPDVLQYEADAFTPTQLDALRERGHQPKLIERDYGNQQVLYWHKPSGTVEAASDPRGIGRALKVPAGREPVTAAE
ncbi:gamma-glutamyltranspeptidase precursor [Pseudomonas sp. SCT]|jgi:gamma-glutamyltranspeptidase/glutathione hydrolase|uniref:gamma-glutamyltransferase n=1 Tax=Pseudomonas sp. (strain SCT) TaxID=412955 RepID=UPI000ECEBCF7|nr:gamma-glutamyltransferase [Pseudomonas sp. SCT]GCA54143.1 gamma-glutamyltranspeptidase precursor [Pseudomonas sp. SCT]